MDEWKYKERWDSKWGNLFKDKGGLIDENMYDNHLRWFDHVQRRAINALVRKSELIGNCSWRPKITLIEVVKNEILFK